MKCTYSEQAYQWPGGVGVMVLAGEEKIPITRSEGIMPGHERHDYDYVLMAHSHTRELEFVRYALLSKYPSSPIESPTK